MMDTETSPMLTPSEVVEHIWCPRFTYFMNVLMIPQFEDRRYKVLKGREVHKRRENENRDYLRKKLGVVNKEQAVYLASPKVRVRGIVDEVLSLDDGTMAPLDFKYTEYQERAFRTHAIQVTLYGLLIEEVYQAEVTRGYVAYIRGGSKVLEVPLSDEIREATDQILDEMFSIIQTGKLPRKTANKNHCIDCCYKNICV